MHHTMRHTTPMHCSCLMAMGMEYTLPCWILFMERYVFPGTRYGWCIHCKSYDQVLLLLCSCIGSMALSCARALTSLGQALRASKRKTDSTVNGWKIIQSLQYLASPKLSCFALVTFLRCRSTSAVTDRKGNRRLGIFPDGSMFSNRLHLIATSVPHVHAIAHQHITTEHRNLLIADKFQTSTCMNHPRYRKWQMICILKFSNDHGNLL